MASVLFGFPFKTTTPSQRISHPQSHQPSSHVAPVSPHVSLVLLRAPALQLGGGLQVALPLHRQGGLLRLDQLLAFGPRGLRLPEAPPGAPVLRVARSQEGQIEEWARP